ncbi:MAG: NTP transferase domain-containing protein [Fibrobacterota bacterium]|nr:NTP transferase domain-containing protein [Fibrobacterota bacterium]QQS04395.1 MAG: NTP transferase domain-containing protein [Fibrobacterota bacterium]
MSSIHPVTCIVPARMGSSRFPGKPLFDVGGQPLVVRSARRALAAKCFDRVVVATEDAVIVDACTHFGLECILTPSFPTGTDRVAWAAQELQAPWVLNLQGDEPVFPLDLLRDLCALLPTDPDALWTAADLALSAQGMMDEDVVKIQLEPGNQTVSRAVDFYRALPEGSKPEQFAVHVGVYGGSLAALQRFAHLPIPPQETLRRIEPLRALAHGMAVCARKGTWARAAVDRREHISEVLDLLRQEGEL